MDTDRIFWIPAVEAYPEIADSYNRIVAFPMDFRTIDLERLDAYESIAELQDDLILVFRNCMDFNEPETDFHNIARYVSCIFTDLVFLTCLGHCWINSTKFFVVSVTIYRCA